jgi:hypothetical protein
MDTYIIVSIVWTSVYVLDSLQKLSLHPEFTPRHLRAAAMMQKFTRDAYT